MLSERRGLDMTDSGGSGFAREDLGGWACRSPVCVSGSAKAATTRCSRRGGRTCCCVSHVAGAFGGAPGAEGGDCGSPSRGGRGRRRRRCWPYWRLWFGDGNPVRDWGIKAGTEQDAGAMGCMWRWKCNASGRVVACEDPGTSILLSPCSFLLRKRVRGGVVCWERVSYEQGCSRPPLLTLPTLWLQSRPLTPS